MSKSFTDLGVSAELAQHLSQRGFSEPYPIQLATLEDCLSGADVSAQAPTGSGKTLAFGIPIVMRVATAKPRKPKALVLAPTRELAAQIADELTQLGSTRKLRVATFYGGVGFGNQLNALRRGVDIAVACPGRLLDLFEQGAIALSDVEIVVIDEADRMADMGFLPVVRTLLAEVRNQHQTLLFSATLQGDVHRLIRDHQRAPHQHILDAPADAMGTRSHDFWKVTREDRAALTASIVTAQGSTIVFCRTKHGADRLTRQLNQAGVDAVAIHGDRSQAQRDRALAQFQAGRAQVLVGTDVAARGIHVDDVACVVHFDPPEDDSTYVHRSGRTGRAGSNGRVISLVCEDQVGLTKKLQRLLGLPTEIGRPDENLPTPTPRKGVPRLSEESSPSRPGTPRVEANGRRNSHSRSARPGQPGRPSSSAASRGTRSRNGSKQGRGPRRAA